MPRLCQVVALEAGTRNRSYAELTALYKKIQKAELINGLTRTYQPRDAEDGEEMPPEATRVQVRAAEVIRDVTTALTRLWDITATRDWANCTATADITILGDSEPLLRDVPVTYLLFLAKQLSDLRAVIVKFPVHDPADRWVWDDSAGCYRTDPPVQTRRTKKIPRNHVKAAPTDKHPAQVDVYYEDVPVGTWTATKFTGGLPESTRAALLARVDELAEAVARAREEANTRHVDDVQVGNTLLGWAFAEISSGSSAS
jgi:hypothetical protein